MLVLVLAVTLAILISASCSLFESVLYAVPKRHIEAMVQAKKQSGKIFKELQGNVEKPIVAILSLNTIANTAGAAIAGWSAGELFGHEAIGYFSAFFTLAVLLFSEIIPKTTGVIYGRILVPLVAYPLKALVCLMTPAILLSSLVTRLISKGKAEEDITAEELRIMAHLSLRSGSIKPFQDDAIENILTLQDKAVKEVMTPRTVVFSLSEHLKAEEAARAGSSWEHSRFPVYDENTEDIVGIVLTKELFIEVAEGRPDTPLTELMRPVHFVAETARLNQVLMEFLESRQHLFVVLDEYGGLAGLISLEDIMEEILGREIVDESDAVADKRELARQRRRQITTTTP